MKGIIFNLVEETVSTEYGDDTWDSLLEAADVEGSYTSLGNYDDAEIHRLVDAGSEALDVPAKDLTEWLGRDALLRLSARYPHFFAPHASTRPFLLTLNDVIHPEVRKVHPDSQPPDFDFSGADPRVLVMTYRSARRLCALAEGMVRGAAEFYGEQVAVTHDVCMLHGADRCELTCTFEPAGEADDAAGVDR